jgi:hypothetical protein
MNSPDRTTGENEITHANMIKKVIGAYGDWSK